MKRKKNKSANAKKTIRKNSLKNKGIAPGSVVFTGNQKVETINIHHLQYDNQSLEEETLDNQNQIIINQLSKDKINWYDIRGLHDTTLIKTLGETFNIHPLALENIVDIHQRPKFDEYENGLIFITKALSFDEKTLRVHTEQVSIFFRHGLLLSFQETDSDLYFGVRERIKINNGRIRTRGTDYLAYALLDFIIDNYYVILDQVEGVIENLESSISQNPDENLKAKIHELKKELLIVRKSIAPTREAVNRFSKSEIDFIDDRTLLFIRDLYDHTIQLMDMVETYRDVLNGLQDLYLSEISFKMNKVMQVLTIITTIFVPLSFLAGLYGMNFTHIPELQFKYGYFVLLTVMFIIAAGLIFWFKKKNWF